MPYEYADQADKVLLRAVPTVDETGVVKKWEVESQYSLDGYKSKYMATLLAPEFVGPPRPPEMFTQTELWDACPTAQWDMVFDSQYHSVMVVVPDTRVSDFDIATLPEGGAPAVASKTKGKSK